MKKSSKKRTPRQRKSNTQEQQNRFSQWQPIAVAIGILLATILINVVLFAFGLQRAYFVCLVVLFAWGFLLALLGLAYLLRPTSLIVRFGKLELRGLTFGIILLAFGSVDMGFPTYLFVDMNQTTQSENKVKPPLSADERSLNKAEKLYRNGQYDACLTVLDKVKTPAGDILEDVQYFTIMARYHSMEISLRRLDSVPAEEIQHLEEMFTQFMNERPSSKRFEDVQYWIGHLYRQLRKDRESALRVFDEIVEDYFSSNWIQGSLYYSAILHYEKATPADKELAVKRVIVLKKLGGLVRIVEQGRDLRAVGIAEELLDKWGITTEPTDTDMPDSTARPLQEDPCLP